MESKHLPKRVSWDHERTAGGPHPQQLRRVGGVWTFQDLPAGQPLRARRARGPIVDARFMESPIGKRSLSSHTTVGGGIGTKDEQFAWRSTSPVIATGSATRFRTCLFTGLPSGAT